MRLKLGFVLLLTCAFVSASNASHAQSSSTPTPEAPTADAVARAAEFKKKADALMQELRYADALGLYKQAYELNADPAILYNQGRALQAVGDYPEALERLESFKRVAPPDVRSKVPDLDGLISEIAARVSHVVFRCTPMDARVAVRERLVADACKGEPIALRAGPATIEIAAEGHEPYRETLELSPGATATVGKPLVERRTESILSVRTRPPGSLVFLDGRPLGPAPIEFRAAPGSHSVLVRHEGYLDQELPVVLQAGERRDLDVPLRMPPAITSRWWFWTAIGSAVAGGAVLGMALASEKSAPSGSFSPGQVRGP